MKKDEKEISKILEDPKIMEFIKEKVKKIEEGKKKEESFETIKRGLQNQLNNISSETDACFSLLKNNKESSGLICVGTLEDILNVFASLCKSVKDDNEHLSHLLQEIANVINRNLTN